MNINRRHFLRGSGAFVALPLLESAGFKAFATSSNKKTLPPKRLAFMGMGYGVTAETWFPDIKDSGAAYKLSQGLAPLKRHKKDFTIVQGCKHKFSRQPHWGSTFWLTGANQYGTPGQSFSNTISADQARAAKFEQNKAARAAETAKRVEAAKRARAEQVAPAQIEKPMPVKAEQTGPIKPKKILINI